MVHPNQLAALRPFKKGQSGNPAGRKPGSKNKLCEDFLSDLYALWKDSGKEILAATAADKPEVIVKTVSQLIPKEMLVAHVGEDGAARMLGILDNLNDAELTDFVAGARLLAHASASGNEAETAPSEGELTNVH